MALVHVTSENFKETVLDCGITVLVDFWAKWCGPCKMLAPIIDEIADEQDGKVLVAKIDVDESPELAIQFGVSSIPTLMVFKEGQKVSSVVGFRPKESILANL